MEIGVEVGESRHFPTGQLLWWPELARWFSFQTRNVQEDFTVAEPRMSSTLVSCQTLRTRVPDHELTMKA